ncbi:MAG: MFS transporter [Rhodospirillaceae bacterium]|nr:MFS transporter [Rhodospirillaceae bacterium]
MSLMRSKRLKKVQYVAVALLTIAGIINYLDRSTLSIANTAISGDLNLTPTEMGLLLSAFSMAYAWSQLPIGVLLDRLGSRIMLGCGLVLWSAAQLCGGLVNSLSQFLVARVLLGIGEAPQFPAGAKVVSEWFNIKERGKPTGMFVASSCLGPMLAPPILTALMLTFGWRIMFVSVGVLGIVVGVLWYIVYRNRADVELTQEETDYLDQDSPEQDKSTKGLTWAEWRGLFGHWTTWGMIFGFMGVIYMLWLYLTWLPGYLVTERGLSIARAGWVVAIPFLFGAAGLLSVGWVADTLVKRGVEPIASRKWPIVVGLIGAAVFTIPAAYTPSATLAVVYISATMFFTNFASGGAWAMVSVAAPPRAVASLGSFQNFGGYFGGSFAPIVTGYIVETTHSFVNALLISAGVSLVAAVAYIVLVRRRVTLD